MIHKTAIVDKKAKISENVEIGPYSIIGPDVEIGANTKLHSHVNIVGKQKLEKIIKYILFRQLEHLHKI